MKQIMMIAGIMSVLAMVVGIFWSYFAIKRLLEGTPQDPSLYLIAVSPLDFLRSRLGSVFCCVRVTPKRKQGS